MGFLRLMYLDIPSPDLEFSHENKYMNGYFRPNKFAQLSNSTLHRHLHGTRLEHFINHQKP